MEYQNRFFKPLKMNDTFLEGYDSQGRKPVYSYVIANSAILKSAVKKMDLKESILEKRLPKHIAIIMDGNGRWAKQKGFIRAIGHENGTKSVRQTVDTCAEICRHRSFLSIVSGWSFTA